MVASRPPPLQLKHDNFRLLSVVHSPAIVQQQKKSFFNKLYKADWRKVVIAVALLNAIRFFLSASNAFQDAIVDHVDHHDGLARMSFIICLLYVLVAIIESLGVVFTYMRRLALVRVYAYLSFAAALFATVAGIINAVVFFGFSNEIIAECASLAMQGKLHLRSTFQGHPWPITQLGVRKAYKLCVVAWTHESSFRAVSLFICTLLPGAVCLFIVYTYYRQATDSNHKACLFSSVPPTGQGGTQLEGGNRDRYSRLGITSAREAANQANVATQRRRVIPIQPREAKGLQNQAQSRKSESFGTSQRKRIATANHNQHSTLISNLGADASSVPQHPEMSSVVNTTSPYKLTPGPPSYAVASVVRGYQAYGARLDAYSPRLD